MTGESTLSKGPITRTGSGGLAQVRFVATDALSFVEASGVS
jgi:hypothetical protein